MFMDAQRLKQMKKGSTTFKNLVWAPRNFISQYKLSKLMCRIEAKVCNISTRRYIATPSQALYRNSFKRLTSQESALPVDADKLDSFSFDEEVDAITACLLKDDPRCFTISIVGITGIGKTSLAYLIYNSQVITENFHLRAWLSGTDNADIMRQVRSLLNMKYFIVVDSDTELPLIIAKKFECTANGTRIIFTARCEWQVPPVSDTNFAFRLHLRSDKESWTLFKHTLRMSISHEMEEMMKQEILRICGGLPMVIVKLGEILSQEEATADEWSRVFDQLIQDAEPWSYILREINQSLPIYLRRCLFRFGLFLAGYRVPARRIMALWIAEDLRGQQSDCKSPEYVAEECLKELVNRNMVQMTEKKVMTRLRHVAYQKLCDCTGSQKLSKPIKS